MLQSISIPVIDDRRTRRMVQLLLVLWLLSVADLLFTLWAHFFTPFQELNPIARTMLAHNLIPTLVLFKLLLTAVGSGIFWYLRGHACAEVGLWGIVLVYVMLAVRWSNYTVGTAAMTGMW